MGLLNRKSANKKINSVSLCAVFRYAKREPYLEQIRVKTSEVREIVKRDFGKNVLSNFRMNLHSCLIPTVFKAL